MDAETEREKMIAGRLYRAADPELVAARMRARRLVRGHMDAGAYVNVNCVILDCAPANVVVAGNPSRIVRRL